MFAQTNYPNTPIGIPPTRYTIAQTGCLLTSFCNLLTRKGSNIDPPTLNAFFRNNNLYVDVDDGVRDDLSWNSVTQYDSATTVVAVGNGLPSTDNSIVKFIYNGTTHFCLVNSVATQTIVDSWDGKVKSWNAYPGGPRAFASYNITEEAKEPMIDKNHLNALTMAYFNRGMSDEEIARYVGKAPYTRVIEDFDSSAEYKSKQKADYDNASGASAEKLTQIKQIVES